MIKLFIISVLLFATPATGQVIRDSLIGSWTEINLPRKGYYLPLNIVLTRDGKAWYPNRHPESSQDLHFALRKDSLVLGNDTLSNHTLTYYIRSFNRNKMVLQMCKPQLEKRLRTLVRTGQ